MVQVEKRVNNSQHMVVRLSLKDVPALLDAGREDLVALANVYFATQVLGQAENTIEAKRRDLEHFFRYFEETFDHLHPHDWYTSVTRDYLKLLARDRDVAQWTACRRYNTIRAFARWADKALDPSPFPLGCPTDGVKAPEEPESDWQGLNKKQELRLIAAARNLERLKHRGPSQGVRNTALLFALLGTGLRISELLRCELRDWNGKGFTDVLQKGSRRRAFVPCLSREGREAIEAWLELRGYEEGPIFSTSTGKAMTRDNAYRVLKRMEAQANSRFPKEEHLTVSPHTLRHTLLRKLAEERGLHYAKKQSGHKSDKYLYRYVTPTDDEMAEEDI